KYPEAKVAFERSLALEPTNAVAHNYLGIVLAQDGRTVEALKHLDLAIKSDSKYGDAHYNRAVVLTLISPPNKPEARASYDRAISLGCDRDTVLEQKMK